MLDRFGLGPDEVAAPAARSAPVGSGPVASGAQVAPVEAAPVEAAPVEAAASAVASGVDVVGPPLLTRAQVEALFEDMVRPALQSDGGDLELVKVEQNDVYVRLVGACQTCPSSIVTMQMGIERLLQEEFPQFGRLIRVDDGA
ncbi:MAG: NifU family protein [Myxococcota bacterium]